MSDGAGQEGSPIGNRRRMGMELRRLREARRMHIDNVAQYLECPQSKVSRIETGKVTARVRDVRDMLELFEVTDEDHRQRLLTLARSAMDTGW